MIALLSVLCGDDGCADMERFGRAKEPFLRRFLVLKHGIPSHDAFSDLFNALARKCTPADASALTDLVSREQACIEAGEASAAIRLSGDFHLVLADIAGNRPLRELLRQLVAQTSLAIARYLPTGTGMCDEDDHERLVDAISGGDVGLSRTIMHAHLTECERRLMLESPEGSNDLHAVFADVVAAK